MTKRLFRPRTNGKSLLRISHREFVNHRQRRRIHLGCYRFEGRIKVRGKKVCTNRDESVKRRNGGA